MQKLKKMHKFEKGQQVRSSSGSSRSKYTVVDCTVYNNEYYYVVSSTSGQLYIKKEVSLTSDENEALRFKLGQRVEKTTGDYSFDGKIVAVFKKRDGVTARYVVESGDGVLMIMNDKQLEDGEETPF